MDDQLRRAAGFSYLHIQDGKSPEWVKQQLAERGLSEGEIDAAISDAKRNLAELASYRNRGLFITLAIAAAVIFFGLWLSENSDNAPGRFRGMWLTVCMLGVTIFAYGIWSRAQKL